MNNTSTIPQINIEERFPSATTRRSPNTAMALPLSSHPIYNLRKASIIIALIGIVLCFLTIPAWNGQVLIATAIFLPFSCIFCVANVVLYAIKKVKDPENDPEWPTGKCMIGDVLYAVTLQLVFWITFTGITYIYYSSSFAAYAALCALLCSLLHAWSFWKQLMARSKKRWLAKLLQQTCPRCGFNEASVESFPRRQDSNGPPPNTFAYAGPSAELRQANVMTPDSVNGVLEEGLLIGSDIETGYGSIAQSEPTIEEPEEIVVSKGKKKKKSSDTAVKGTEPRADQGGFLRNH